MFQLWWGKKNYTAHYVQIKGAPSPRKESIICIQKKEKTCQE
jgi:hypothetical protein